MGTYCTGTKCMGHNVRGGRIIPVPIKSGDYQIVSYKCVTASRNLFFVV
jgi:hypothetical protein